MLTITVTCLRGRSWHSAAGLRSLPTRTQLHAAIGKHLHNLNQLLLIKTMQWCLLIPCPHPLQGQVNVDGLASRRVILNAGQESGSGKRSGAELITLASYSAHGRHGKACKNFHGQRTSLPWRCLNWRELLPQRE